MKLATIFSAALYVTICGALVAYLFIVCHGHNCSVNFTGMFGG